MLDILATVISFYGTICVLPVFLISFIVLKIYNTIWLKCISFLHPDVEFIKYTTVRTLLDTHRNQGIVSILLAIKGPEHPEAIKRHLHEVVNRRNKSRNLVFPKLQQNLITRCGVYAWQRIKFDIEQHITLAKFTYKGRAVTDYNIQEYVSEIVTKYLPNGISPWQIIIIPTSEDHHYVLLKIHHILLSEGVNIGDILPLIPPTKHSTGSFLLKSPLVEVVQKPTAIPTIIEKLSEEISNYWNEFVCCYDPLEKPELLKDTPTVKTFMATFIVTLVTIVKESKKGFKNIKPDAISKAKFVFMTISKETKRRQISGENFLHSIFKSLSPSNIISNLVKNIYFLITLFPVKIPLLLYSEGFSLYKCYSLGYCPYPHTIVGLMYTYIPLVYRSMKEIWDMLIVLFSAPRTIFQDLLGQEESLQTITLCGRKAVAWSDPVKVEVIKNIAKKLNVSETEVLLSAVSMCISKYITQLNDAIPKELPVTIRNINSNYLYATGPQITYADSMSGIIFLNLPIVDPQSDLTQIDNLHLIKQKLAEALNKQKLSHLLTYLQTKYNVLTKIFPQTFAGVYLKYLSRKYVVTITELTNRYPNVTQKSIWGQEVTSVIYWRPPQANTSISLCLNEYADHVKLGVMCDAQLVPHHPFLARGFPQFIKDLVDTAEIVSLVKK